VIRAASAGEGSGGAAAAGASARRSGLEHPVNIPAATASAIPKYLFI
jgi:hypothetical protein